MSEYIDGNNENIGQIQISDDVIAIIAGTAACEIENAFTIGAASQGSIFSKKNIAKGIKVNVEETGVTIEAEIAVKYGAKITETAQMVQERIKDAVETMTGLSVETVNILVTAIITEKTKAEKDAE